MIKRVILCTTILSLASFAQPALAQSSAKVPGSMDEDLKAFIETPAVPGYEGNLAKLIRARLVAFSPKSDNLGDVIVTIGSGSPHRVIVAPMDEPGFVVSRITDDGYLQLQRLPQGGALPLFNELYAAQPVELETSSGKWISGVVAGLSVHLQPGRLHAPDPSDIDNMYVDIGASSAAEARRAGADLLSPLAMDRTLYTMANGLETSPAIGDRFGDAALVELLRRLDASKLNGTLTVAFVAQQWAGARGFERVLDEINPDELIYVGRLTASGPIPGQPGLHRAPRLEPGSGVLVGTQDASAALTGFAADLKKLADENKFPMAADYSAPLVPPGYLRGPKLPDNTVHLAIATAWPSTPAEMISSSDLSDLSNLLEAHIQGSVFQGVSGGMASGVVDGRGESSAGPSNEYILSHLVETYGVSDHEGLVRDEVKRLLPKWAKPETDDAGDLILHMATPPARLGEPAGSHPPRILFVAHMDEIGYEVKEILPNGRLAVESKGGGTLDFYLGHAALVHTTKGPSVPGVMELPEGWDQPNFQWPRGRALMYHVDIGARSPDEAAKLGVQVGDFVTIPKHYHRLANLRANCRSFDDRMGDSALISAAWALGQSLKDRDVTFVFSTGEELGLVGAGAVAKRLAAEGKAPDYVFAIDTFVSSDSPIESPRFGDAKLGDGFVVRAVDGSNIVPRKLVEKVVSIARLNHIPAQYGVTGGGNDGSAFLPYGSIDIALGWPLRYSHSPGEVIDLRDLDALSRIVAAISRSW